VKRGQEVTATAGSLDEEGRGLADVDGVVLHVADLLPGEAARVAVEHVSPHRPEAYGRVLARVGEPAPERTAPACPAFGRCGGCVLQSLVPAAQLEAKRRRVEVALAGLALPGPVPTPIAAPAPLGYRNRGVYVVGGRAGELVFGAYAPGSHELVDTLGCRVVAPRIDEVARRALAALDASGLPPFREADRSGALRYVVLRANRDGQILCGLVTMPKAPRAPLEQLAIALLGADPRVVGVVQVRNASTSGAVLSDDHELLAGKETLPERVAGVVVELALGDFTQVNLDAADRLYADLAARVAAPGLRAIDLYSGVGAIAFALAARGAEVLGIERNPRAALAAAAAAPAGVRFVEGDAATLAHHGEPADLVVVNPPRKGLDAATRAALLARRPASIAYVSCDPATLARDLAEMCAAGYRVAWVQPYDLMPGAPPIETVVLLVAGQDGWR
jgi:23S rRNA (uracil1939-C5)-methyltransferase